MKVLTWNINGIRAATGKKSIKEVLDELDSDVICLQETKVTRDMLDEPTAIVDGYEAYFSFSKKRSGYSGTANYCLLKASPSNAEEGLAGGLTRNQEKSVGHYFCSNHFSNADLDALDSEGRSIITEHTIRLPCGALRQVAVINVYVPLAGEREDRLRYKLQFLGLLQARAEALLNAGLHVIIVGDLNLTHKKIDNCDPDVQEDFTTRSSRIWMNNMLRYVEQEPRVLPTNGNLAELCPPDLKGKCFSDVFRRLNPYQKNAFTNWCTSTDARKSNYGRRLDYILIDNELAKYAEKCEILPEVEGSDHCPVVVTLNCEAVPSETTPGICAKKMPEFRGQQQTLSNFFKKNKSSQLDYKEKTVLEAHSQETKEKSVKRPYTDELTLSQPSKLKKTMSNPQAKQSSLKSFFTKPNKSKPSDSVISKNDYKPDSVKDIASVKQVEISTNDSKPQSHSSDTHEVEILNTVKKKSSVDAWRSLLGGLPPPPLCPGHKEPCLLKTVNKSGPNKNRQFYCCPRPEGPAGKAEFRCNFFQWLKERPKPKK